MRDMRPRVIAFARRRLGDAGAAEDFAHEALSRTIEALRAGRIERPEAAGGWVLATCRRLLANDARKRRRRAELEPVARAGASLAVDFHEPNDPWARLAHCVAGLRAYARDVLWMTYVQELDSTEIGAALGKKPGAIRVARKRALAALRRCVEGGADA